MVNCENCRYFLYDSSNGTSECDQYDNMSEEDTDRYYTNGKNGCPFHKEYIDSEF